MSSLYYVPRTVPGILSERRGASYNFHQIFKDVLDAKKLGTAQQGLFTEAKEVGG